MFDLRVPVSLLHVQGFCEHQIYLERVKKISPKQTMQMKTGSDAHESLEQKHAEKATITLSPEQAMNKSITDKKTYIAREMFVNGKILCGKIDEIHFSPEHIIIIDDKPGNWPYLSIKKQIWGYCLAFEEQFTPRRSLIACMRKRGTDEIVWQETFIPEHKEAVTESTQRIINILAGKTQGEPSKNPNKCRICRFKENCQFAKTGEIECLVKE